MDRILQNKRGTSLIEVLVVMVVLLIGIMTVIQMFPTGFGVVRAAESRTIATRLAQQELERWKAMPGNLPDGIIPIKANGSFFADEPGYSADIRNMCVLAGPPFGEFVDVDSNLERGNVLNIRQVIGETTSIPAPGYFQTGTETAFGCKYTLAFSPIDSYRDSDEKLQGITIKSGSLKRIVSTSGYTPSLRPGQYGILYSSDSDTFHVAFPATSSSGVQRKYYISYSYWAWNGNSEPVLKNVLNQEIDPDPLLSNQVYWIEVKIDTTGYDHVEIDQSSDTCARGFFEWVPGSSDPEWPSDPYTFKLADPILGIISFNPNAQNRYEYTAFGKRPIKASIDYRIYDPRIIREDKVVPDAADTAKRIPVKLALRFILNAGEPGNITDGDTTDNPDEPTFEGLMRESGGRPQLGTQITSAGELTIPYSMIIVDLKTGLRVGVPASGGQGVPIYTSDFIDYKTGVVNLPGPGETDSNNQACLIDYNNNIIYNNVDLCGRNLRFLYRADGDWSVQCQKAYSYYSRVYDTASVDYNHFYLSDSNPNRLLFAPCDAGKTVSVDYTYSTKDGEEHRVVGQECQISDAASDESGEDDLYYLDIPVPVSSYTIKRISVIGTSLMARVIWRDGKNWRHVDLETNLTRGE